MDVMLQRQLQGHELLVMPSVLFDGWLLLLKASIPLRAIDKITASMIIAFFISFI